MAENYPAIAHDLLRPLLELCSRSRAACGGDIDKFLILLAVGMRTTSHPDFARRTQAELLSGEIPVFPGLGTNVRSIADSLGMPKETVRRKVAELVDAGWLAREGNELYFTAQAYSDLVPVREAIEFQAVRYHEIVQALIDAQPADGAVRTDSHAR